MAFIGQGKLARIGVYLVGKRGLLDSVAELVEVNGEDWIRTHRQQLIDEWYYIVRQGIID